MLICENCKNEHDGSYGSGRFCSCKCARSFSSKDNRIEINQKISITLSKRAHPKVTKVCPTCGIIFEVNYNKRKQENCSAKCSNNSESKKNKLRQAIQEKVSQGIFSGWKQRTKKPSYPEQYFIDLFEREQITEYIREFRVNKWFIDFAFEKSKIALEVDGKQHQHRKHLDQEKDDFLISEGWTILRIEWYNPINDENKRKLFLQIEEMKKLLLSVG